MLNSNDCNDSNVEINPATKWYIDEDGDGLGGDDYIISCKAIDGYVLNSNDLEDVLVQESNFTYFGAFKLYNASTDKFVANITEGIEINLEELGTNELNIEATTQKTPRSVAFYLNDAHEISF